MNKILTAEETAATFAGSAAPAQLSIREAVAAGLTNLGGRTRESVIEYFAAAKAEKQAQALIKGLDKLNGFERELQKINRPDVITYDSEGAQASATFSKERIEERKKLNEQIEKLSNAINKADDTNDFDKLFELTK